jgi:uncharacterized membrane protein
VLLCSLCRTDSLNITVAVLCLYSVYQPHAIKRRHVRLVILFMLLSFLYDIVDFYVGESLKEHYAGIEIPLWFEISVLALTVAELMAKFAVLFTFVKVSVNFRRYKQMMTETTQSKTTASDNKV